MLTIIIALHEGRHVSDTAAQEFSPSELSSSSTATAHHY
jgi:hypothetical protein